MALEFLNDAYFAAKVGIGTESPSEKLEVNGTVAIGNATDGIKLRLTGTVGEILGLSTTSGSWNDLDIRTQAATQLYLKTDGNVGIGTTSPGVKLDAMESAVNNSVMTLGTASGIFSIRPSTRDYGLFFGVIYNNGDAWMQVGRSDGTAAAYNLLLQPSGGNVGIGTTAPTSRLHVNGTGATHGEYFRISNGTTQIYELQPSIYNVTNNGFGIYDVTDSAYRLVIDTSGNVGIGTTSPDLKLDVTHATSGEYVATFQNTAANLELKLGVTSTNYLNIQGQQINNSTAFNMSLQADGGDVGINTTTPTQKLHVAGNARVTGAYYDSNNSPGTANQVLISTVTGTDWIDGSAIPGVPAGSGTLNTVAMWTPDGDTLGDAPITISGSDSTFTGTVTAATYYKSSGTSAVLGTNAAGEVLLRPTSSISSTAQSSFTTTLATIGTDATFTGSVTVNASAARILTINRGTASGGYMAFQNNGVDKFYIGTRGVVSGSGGTGYDFYAVGGNDLRFFGGTLLTLTLDTSANATFAGNVIVDSALLSNQENTDVDTGTEAIASVAIATYTAAFFDFVIKKGTNVRSGTVYACHDGTSVAFTETSTQDLGDTSDVTLNVVISTIYLQLQATTTSDDWSVKSLIRAI